MKAKLFLLLVCTSFIISGCRESEEEKIRKQNLAVWLSRLEEANNRLESIRKDDACYQCISIDGGCLCSNQNKVVYTMIKRYSKGSPPIKPEFNLVTLSNTNSVNKVRMAIENGNTIENIYKLCEKESYSSSPLGFVCEKTIKEL